MIIPQAFAQSGNTLPSTADEVVDGVITILSIGKDIAMTIAIIVLFFLLGKVIRNRIVASIRQAKGDIYPDMESMIGRIMTYGMIFVGASASAQFVFGVDFMQVLGFLSLGIGFAFKDILMNLMSGIIIVLQDRYHIGDFIQVGNSVNAAMGTVMEIQTRATILKTLEGTEVIVPNSRLLNETVIVYTAHHARRLDVDVGVHYSTDLSLAKRLVEEVMKNHPYVLKTPPAKVILDSFGNSSINLSCRFWIDPKDPETPSWITMRSEMIHAIKKVFEAHGITIPFPQLTLYQASSTEGKEWQKEPSNKDLLKTESDHIAEEEMKAGTAIEHSDGKTVKANLN